MKIRAVEFSKNPLGPDDTMLSFEFDVYFQFHKAPITLRFTNEDETREVIKAALNFVNEILAMPEKI